MKEAALLIEYPDFESYDDHAEAALAMLPDTRKFPGCLEARVGLNPERSEIALFQVWESLSHLDSYLTWRAERGDLDARSATMRREQDFRTFSMP